MTMRKILIATLALAALAIPATLAAFPNIQFWHMPSSGAAGVNRAGANGYYGTGMTSEWGIQCAHCHIGGEGKIDLQINTTPAFGDDGNGNPTYTAGVRYTFNLALIGEHLGIGLNENGNGFALGIEDAGGNVIRGYITDSGVDSANCQPNPPASPPTGTTYVLGDCHAVVFVSQTDRTAWTFDWVAPAAGTGELTVYYGVVDGDHLGSSSLGDDVKQGKLKLVEN